MAAQRRLGAQLFDAEHAATVLQSRDDHPHHRLTMPLQHGSLFLCWGALPVRRRCAGDGSARPGESI